MEHVDVQDKAGDKFKPGEIVYVKRIFQPHRIGLICKLMGTIENSKHELEEVYEVLIGKELKFYNAYYLEPLNQETIKDYIHMRKN